MLTFITMITFYTCYRVITSAPWVEPCTTIVEPIGIIISKNIDNHLNLLILDSSYSEDFTRYKKITGNWSEMTVSCATYNLSCVTDNFSCATHNLSCTSPHLSCTSYNLTCGSKTFRNVFYNVEGHFFYLHHNYKSYKLAKLILDESTGVLYFTLEDFKNTSEYLRGLGLEVDGRSHHFWFSGTLYDPNSDTFYRVVDGQVRHKIVQKIGF